MVATSSVGNSWDAYEPRIQSWDKPPNGAGFLPSSIMPYNAI